MKKLCVLGITGSIGKNVSLICKDNPLDFIIKGVALNKNIDGLNDFLLVHKEVEYIYIHDKNAYLKAKNLFPNITFFSSNDGICKLIDSYDYDMVVNALVGFDGLIPTIHTLKKGITCALANKESLVVGGDIINQIIKENHAKLFPIDSEHVALAKLLKGHEEDVTSLIITASGGAFRDYKVEELSSVSVEDALRHPSWSMGEKITIDSATMMNKGFEIIEAYHLFHFPISKIQVLMHDESVIHSLVELKDHSLLADLGIADMRIAISYALYEGHYHALDLETLSLAKLSSLHFREIDYKKYKAINLALNAIEIGHSMPCVLNASNDACNLAFRERRLSFIKITEIVEKVMLKHKLVLNPSIDDLININSWAYQEAENLIREEEK